MFTGIVEEVGTVRRNGRRLAVSAVKVLEDTVAGSSIAVSGVCLTAAEVKPAGAHGTGGTMSFDLSEETLARSALGGLSEGDEVNLERPATLITRLGGHLVQGHVDGVGRIASIEDGDSGRMMVITPPDGLRRYIVEKGSIAVDGVSLTVTAVEDGGFGVALIPFTLEATTLGRMHVGDLVNLEVDLIAKYVERLMGRVE
jgi:riboflavin synthase